MKERSVKIGLIQLSVPDKKDKALEKAVSLVKQAAQRGAKIICLPELFTTVYFPQKRGLPKGQYAELAPGKTSKVMSELAKLLRVVLIAPIYEKTDTGKYFNTALVFSETGKLLGKYRKNHIPHDPGFYEKDYFGEGDLGYPVFKTKYAKIAVLICYDQWFPEGARMAKLKGAEIIFYPTAIGDIIGNSPREGDWHSAWETVQRGHAIANSLPVAIVNRVGREGKTHFWGQSFVSNAFGKVLKRASKTKDEVLVVDLDLSLNKFISKGWGFMRNRRPRTYDRIIDD